MDNADSSLRDAAGWVGSRQMFWEVLGLVWPMSLALPRAMLEGPACFCSLAQPLEDHWEWDLLVLQTEGSLRPTLIPVSGPPCFQALRTPTCSEALESFRKWTPLRELRAGQAGQPPALLPAFPLSPQRRTGMQLGKFSLLSLSLGPGGRGGNWPLGNHTQLPIHSGQRLYILNSCCLCLPFNSAALTQLPETNLQGTTVTLAFQSYLICTPSPPSFCHTHTLCLHFISKTALTLGSVFLICPMALFWRF